MKMFRGTNDLLSPALLGEALLLSTWGVNITEERHWQPGALLLPHYLSGKLLFLTFRLPEKEKLYLLLHTVCKKGLLFLAFVSLCGKLPSLGLESGKGRVEEGDRNHKEQ